MRECYNLNQPLSLNDISDIGDIYYSRLNKVKEVFFNTEDEKLRTRITPLYFRLAYIVQALLSEAVERSKPRPRFHPGGAMKSKVLAPNGELLTDKFGKLLL